MTVLMPVKAPAIFVRPAWEGGRWVCRGEGGACGQTMTERCDEGTFGLVFLRCPTGRHVEWLSTELAADLKAEQWARERGYEAA
jgi:hypothetical protein